MAVRPNNRNHYRGEVYRREEPKEQHLGDRGWYHWFSGPIIQRFHSTGTPMVSQSLSPKFDIRLQIRFGIR